MIYTEVLSAESLDLTVDPHNQLRPSLLFTCKQIFAEGYDAYFQQLHRVEEHAKLVQLLP